MKSILAKLLQLLTKILFTENREMLEHGIIDERQFLA